MEVFHEIEQILGVFSSKEGAESALEYYNNTLDGDLESGNVEIEECVLDSLTDSCFKYRSHDMIPEYFPACATDWQWEYKKLSQNRDLYYVER